MKLRKIILITFPLVLLTTMFYYCGTTAVVEEGMEDTTNPDIKINNDAASDAGLDTISDIPTGDTILPDVSEDIGVSDTSEDTESDTESTDAITDTPAGDTYEDISQDTGSEDVGKDVSGGDNEITDTSTKLYSISGKVTVNHGNPEKNKSVFVFLFDKMPAENVQPYAYTTTDSSNDYSFENIPVGKYYVLAIYDIDGDGNPNPNQGDLIGFYPKNPVDLSAGSVTGVDINITTIPVSVASVFMRRQQQSNAYLISLTAKVLNPKDGTPLSDATVSVTDGVSQQPFTLTYNSQTEQYERSFNPYGPGAVAAVDGTYTFIVQHTAYGSQPVKVPINHRPLKEALIITQPQNNSTIQAGEDLLVEWKNPPDADINILIQVLFRKGTQFQEVFRDENYPIPNPYIIKGSYLQNPGTYFINVISGRFRVESNGTSIEATSGSVMVNAQ